MIPVERTRYPEPAHLVMPCSGDLPDSMAARRLGKAVHRRGIADKGEFTWQLGRIIADNIADFADWVGHDNDVSRLHCCRDRQYGSLPILPLPTEVIAVKACQIH